LSELGSFDACVLGHVVLDRNVIDGVLQPPRPGGAAYYAAVAYARLGLDTAVITRVGADDEALLLGELRALGVTVVNLGAPRSTVFCNVDSPSPGSLREQRVEQEAPAIGRGDLVPLVAATWHLGPLRHDDLDPALAAACRSRGGRIAIDVQGLVRRVDGGLVVPRSPAMIPDLEPIDVLKADDAEILTLTGASEVDAGARAALAGGAGEVVITEADRGSVLFAGARRIAIPAYHPAAEIDPTGCGDTYLAAYLARRLVTGDLAECGRFAAAAAALKLESTGPFRSDVEGVAALRARAAPAPA
jgi:sugar/nucleoside kinase (ribokinase family)